MTEPLTTLPLSPSDESEIAARHTTGILPSQVLRELIRDKVIVSTTPLEDDQVQPASIDLRLGATAFRVRASFLPGDTVTVEEKIEILGMHAIDLTDGAVLEKGCVYIVPLMESLRLGKREFAVANPKSSTGRLDIFTRLIPDRATEFDRVIGPYRGPLYAEISPRTFSVLVRKGSRLDQIRLRRGSPLATDTALRRLHEEVGLIHTPDDAGPVQRISKGLPVTVDLRGEKTGGLVGYKAKAHTDVIDIDRAGAYDIAHYWESIAATESGTLILDPNAFYILASKEAVTVPPDHAAEMAPFNPLHGEFRVHYAGFFDPGFGYAEAGGAGARAVLEVRSFEVPFMLEHGQVVGRLMYERLTAVPDRLYGGGIGSSYQHQGLALSKHFKRPDA